MKLTLGEELEDLDLAKTQEALTKRRNILPSLVGSLYPRILMDEITTLELRVWVLKSLDAFKPEGNQDGSQG